MLSGAGFTPPLVFCPIPPGEGDGYLARHEKTVRRIQGEASNHMLRRTAAAIQIAIVLLIVGYGTYHLYQGHFVQSYATLPFLVGYYLLVVAWKRRQREREMDRDDEDER
jgi:amino acid permease